MPCRPHIPWEHGLGSNYGEGAFHRVDLKKLRYPAQLYLGRDRRFGHVSEISVHQESCKKSDSMFCVSSLPFELPYGQIVHLIDVGLHALDACVSQSNGHAVNDTYPTVGLPRTRDLHPQYGFQFDWLWHGNESVRPHYMTDFAFPEWEDTPPLASPFTGIYLCLTWTFFLCERLARAFRFDSRNGLWIILTMAVIPVCTFQEDRFCTTIGFFQQINGAVLV